MGRRPCCEKEGLNRGAWTAEEDRVLVEYMKAHSQGRWENVPKGAGLNRCGKSCRFRWLNYLRPDIKRGNISPDEEDLIVRLHRLLGNRWSLIAGRIPGRTDNEIKNYWNTTFGKRAQNDTKRKLGAPKDQHYPEQPGGQTEPELQENDTTGNLHSTGQSPKQGEETSEESLAEFWAAQLERSEVAMNMQASTKQARRDNNGFGINIGGSRPYSLYDGNYIQMESDEHLGLENNGATIGLSSGFYHGGDAVQNDAMDFDFGDFCLSDLLNSAVSDPSPLPSLDPRLALPSDEPVVQNLNMAPNHIIQSWPSLNLFDSPEDEWLYK